MLRSTLPGVDPLCIPPGLGEETSAVAPPDSAPPVTGCASDSASASYSGPAAPAALLPTPRTPPLCQRNEQVIEPNRVLLQLAQRRRTVASSLTPRRSHHHSPPYRQPVPEPADHP